MRLNTIRLSGFKSFVDPTTLSLRHNISAIVGPNGCGKSNIVDAIRWVTGESSAKQIRGGKLEDIIFTGSDARQPTSRASVELIFDNEDGRIGGEYASYAEISVRREITRDSPSEYFLNGRRCRRRDVQDVFLGTGFGSRGYAVIEQGLTNKLVESRPDELRFHIEEAAGVSRYRERKRETESKIRETNQNLDVVRRQLQEIEQRLRLLRSQARAARRHQLLTDQRIAIEARLIALEISNDRKELATVESELGAQENDREKARTSVRSLETRLQKLEEQRHEQQQVLDATQRKFFDSSSSAQALELDIESRRKRNSELREELGGIATDRRRSQEQLGTDDNLLKELEAEINATEPSRRVQREELDASTKQLQDSQEQVRRSQLEMSELLTTVSRNESETQLRRGMIDEANRLLTSIRNRIAQLPYAPDTSSIWDGAEVKQQISVLESEQNALEEQVTSQSEELKQLDETRSESDRVLDMHQSSLSNLREEFAAAEAVYEATLGGSNFGSDASSWIKEHGLDEAPRLSEQLQVLGGWERAVEVVLGQDINGIQVDSLSQLNDAVHTVPPTNLTLFEGSASVHREHDWEPLTAHVSGGTVNADVLLEGVFTASSISDALQRRHLLRSGQSFVTADGVRVSSSWIRFRSDASKTGLLTLRSEVEQLEKSLAAKTQQSNAAQATHTDLIQRIESLRQELARVTSELDDTKRKLNTMRTVYQQLVDGTSEIDEQTARIAKIEKELTTLSERSSVLHEQNTNLESEHERLLKLQNDRQDAANLAQKAYYDEDSKYQSLTSRLEMSRTNRLRLVEQLANLDSRYESTERAINSNAEELPSLEASRDSRLTEVSKLESELQERASLRDSLETEYRELADERVKAQGILDSAQENLNETIRRRDAVMASIRASRDNLDRLNVSEEKATSELNDDDTKESLDDELVRVLRRLERIGPINETAGEELDRENERKQYLDQQVADLGEALDRLQSAFERIERDTRQLFSQTFNQINENLQALFPRLFGGGSAGLTLTESDLLDGGVVMEAHPPGKKNTSVQSLSGGELALSSIALVLAIFQLNPSPVCLLDEVDANLDDTNVSRFAELVVEMSHDVQFVVITHNRTTMQHADSLIGITMQEAGVSRVVSVDAENLLESTG